MSGAIEAEVFFETLGADAFRVVPDGASYQVVATPGGPSQFVAIDTPGGTVEGFRRELRQRAQRAATLALAQQMVDRTALVSRRDLANQAAKLHDRNRKRALEDAGRRMSEGRRLSRAFEAGGDQRKLTAAMERVFLELLEAQQQAGHSERLAAGARDYASGLTRQIGKLPKSARPERRAARRAAFGHQAFRPRREPPFLRTVAVTASDERALNGEG